MEERRGDQSAALSRLSEKQLCFYSGSVINHTSSLASVSTCGGLVNPSFFSLLRTVLMLLSLYQAAERQTSTFVALSGQVWISAARPGET